MESIPKNPILEFHSDTLQAVRKLYNLDQPGRMEEALSLLEEWVKKQEHFVQKEFSRDYLERLIIMNKGSLEKVKLRLDKVCSLRTVMPHIFKSCNAKYDFEELHVQVDAILPKLTTDNYRIYLTKHITKDIPNNFFLQLYRRLVILWEYSIKHDYAAGGVIVMDLREVEIKDIISNMDIMDLRLIMRLFMEGYGARIKGFHIITTSKFVDIFIKILRQVFSAKIGSRIYSHVIIETLYNFVPKDILPVEYGGQEQSLLELHGKWLDVLSSSEHLEYMKFVCASTTDESRRLVDKFNEELSFTSGSFRTMAVD